MLWHAHCTRTTITDVYARYLAWCDGQPVFRSPVEIDAGPLTGDEVAALKTWLDDAP